MAFISINNNDGYNVNNGKDLWSTGNRAKDIFGGLAIGLSNLNNRPGQYYVKSNWKGRGLADTGLGYVANQNYQNPYDQANLLTSLMYGKGKGFNLSGRLGNMFNRNKQGIQQDGFAPVNTLQDFIGNEANEQQLQPETLMDYLQQETGYNNYTPQLLPYEFDERGGFDYNIV